MLKGIRKLASDTLTRSKIEEGVRRFAGQYSHDNGTVYDLGGARRYSYSKYFTHYKTVNLDKKEKPDVLADAANLPLVAGSVSNMLCIALLEHVNNPDAVLNEMHRALKPNGRAFIWVPFYWREHNYPIDNYRFSHSGIVTLLKKHNFAIIESSHDHYNGRFFIMSHDTRFLMKDPHISPIYDPLLYAHALLCGLARLDDVFKLKHPSLYTGVEVIVEKE